MLRLDNQNDFPGIELPNNSSDFTDFRTFPTFLSNHQLLPGKFYFPGIEQ